jgi:hypothetical protein
MLPGDHGAVLEIVLPALLGCAGEYAVLISAPELRKLIDAQAGPSLQNLAAGPRPGDWDFLPADYRLADSETVRHDEHNPLISKS